MFGSKVREGASSVLILAFLMVFVGVMVVASEADAGSDDTSSEGSIVTDLEMLEESLSDDGVRTVILGDDIVLTRDVTIDRSVTVIGNGEHRIISEDHSIVAMTAGVSILFTDIVFDILNTEGSPIMQMDSVDLMVEGCSFIRSGEHILSVSYSVSGEYILIIDGTDLNDNMITIDDSIPDAGSIEVLFVDTEDINLAFTGGVVKVVSDGEAVSDDIIVILDGVTNLSSLTLDESYLDLNGYDMVVDAISLMGEGEQCASSISNGSLNTDLIAGAGESVLEVSDLELVASVVGVDVRLVSGTVEVPEGGELHLDVGTELQLSSDTVLKVYGTVEGEGTIVMEEGSENVSVMAVDPDSLADMAPGIAIDELSPMSGADASGFQEDIDANTVVIVENDIFIDPGYDVTIPEGKVIILNASIIIAGPDSKDEGGGLVIEGSSVSGSGMIILQEGANLSLDGADVRVPVIEVGEASVEIDDAKEYWAPNDRPTDLGIGYGNTLILEDLVVSEGKHVQVWGTVIVKGTVTIQEGACFDVYASGEAQVEGDLIVEGAVTVMGSMEVDGSVKVYNPEGGASFVLPVQDTIYTPNVSINKGAVFDLLKPEYDGTAPNSLDANGMFLVMGTMNVTGEIGGTVIDDGNLIMDGSTTSEEFSVVLTDGNSIAIESVDGMIHVLPMVSLDYDFGPSYSFGSFPQATISNAGGVTMEAVCEMVNLKTLDSEDFVGILFGLTVSGELIAVDGSDDYGSTLYTTMDIYPDFPRALGSSYMNIGDLVLGENTVLEMDGDVTVVGEVIAVADGTHIYSFPMMDMVDGTLTFTDVEGTIVVGESCTTNPDDDGVSGDLMVNGVKYVMDVDGERVTYYTIFEDAIAVVPEAVWESVWILGEVEVDSVTEVPSGANVFVEGCLEIGADGKVTVAEDALLDSIDGVTVVDGVLTVVDKDFGILGKENLDYQILNETETSATYSGLAFALKNAEDGDIIILNQDARITESISVPEGVTLVVPEGMILTIGDFDENVTLTVEGKLDVRSGGMVTKAKVAVDTEVTIEVPGVIIMADEEAVPDDLMSDYVSFNMDVEDGEVHVHSNLEYAAENDTYGRIQVYGDVVAGDVTFTKAPSKTFDVMVHPGSSLTVSSITLYGADLNVYVDYDDNGTEDQSDDSIVAGSFTGTIIVPIDDDPVIIKAEGSAAFTVDAVMVDGEVDSAILEGNPIGRFSIESGTVHVDGILRLVNWDHAIYDADASISGDATLVVREAAGLLVLGQDETGRYVQIGGKVIMQSGSVMEAHHAYISGEVLIECGSDSMIGDGTIVTGSIIASEETESWDAGRLFINNSLFLGSSTTTGAVGTIAGVVFTEFDILVEGEFVPAEGFLVAYPGSDISGAEFVDVEGEVTVPKSTSFYINGQQYMTVFTVVSEDVSEFVNGLGIEIPGFETPQEDGEDSIGWYLDESMEEVFSGNIGDVDALYTEFDEESGSGSNVLVAVVVLLNILVVAIAAFKFMRG